MKRLRDLDDRVVPRAAARLRSVLDRGGSRRPAPRPVSARRGPLRRLDDRFARRGPLGLVRDVPQIGLAVIAALLLAGAGVALARSDAGTGRGTSVLGSAPRVLGPEPGTSVQQYVDDATAGAAERSRQRPERQHEALVSLTGYRTPADARELLDGLEVQRAYLRVPTARETEVLSTDVNDLLTDLRAFYSATAERKAAEQRELVSLSRSIEPVDDEQRRFRDFYELSARIAGQEATAYRTGCACVFAAVVRGPARTLAALPALQGVRVVELAPGGVPLAELTVRPLVPEQTTTVAPVQGVQPPGS